MRVATVIVYEFDDEQWLDLVLGQSMHDGVKVVQGGRIYKMTLLPDSPEERLAVARFLDLRGSLDTVRRSIPQEIIDKLRGGRIYPAGTKKTTNYGTFKAYEGSDAQHIAQRSMVPLVPPSVSHGEWLTEEWLKDRG